MPAEELAPTATAVVVVHGMGEQKPLQTLKGFVRTALKPVGGKGQRKYYSRPALLTESFEARRYIAFRIPRAGVPVFREKTELYEYHWSYLMTGNRFGDVLGTVLRLVFQPIWRVPSGLRWAYLLIWLTVAAWIAVNVAGVVHLGASARWLVRAAVGNGIAIAVVVLVLLVLHFAQLKITQTFVDVVRYLDTSPRSYTARRAIRGGLVSLLRELHADGRYGRIVVVAHSLGGYIAYDALGSLWTELHPLHGGTAETTDPVTPLDGLVELEKAADQVLVDGDAGAYQSAQFELWRGLRRQGNPWLVTDLITAGTPMYFADLLFTHSRKEFRELMEDGELWRCPPRSEQQLADDPKPPPKVRYGWSNGSREVLSSWSMFAAVRWSNFWFPPALGFFGDWFGGRLKPLFGAGILDVEVTGNKPGRYCPGFAHTQYFAHPDQLGPNDIAHHIQAALRLDLPLETIAGPKMSTVNQVTGGGPLGNVLNESPEEAQD